MMDSDFGFDVRVSCEEIWGDRDEGVEIEIESDGVEFSSPLVTHVDETDDLLF